LLCTLDLLTGFEKQVTRKCEKLGKKKREEKENKKENFTFWLPVCVTLFVSAGYLCNKLLLLVTVCDECFQVQHQIVFCT